LSENVVHVILIANMPHHFRLIYSPVSDKWRMSDQ